MIVTKLLTYRGDIALHNKPRSIALVLACVVVTACTEVDPTDAIVSASPAKGEQLRDYSRDISEAVDLANDAALVQRFCHNSFGSPCPHDIYVQLKRVGFSTGTGVDLADAFVEISVDPKSDSPSADFTDERFLNAAYRVILAREPDPGGFANHLRFIRDKGNRKQVLRSMLQSQEFVSLQ